MKLSGKEKEEWKAHRNELKAIIELAELMPSMTPEQLRDLYFIKGVDALLRLKVLEQDSCPYDVLLHAMFEGATLSAKRASRHHAVFDKDLEKASKSHKWKDVREYMVGVLERRRAIGYFGPGDFEYTINNPLTGLTINEALTMKLS